MSSASLYTQALAKRPGYAHGYLKLGHALKEAHDLKGAEAAYWRAVALAGSKAAPFLHLGHVLKLSGDQDGSLAAYLAAWSLEPANAEVSAELHGNGYSPSDLKRMSGDLFGSEFSLPALSSSERRHKREAEGAVDLSPPLEVLLKVKAVRADLARLLAVETR